jgi:hypothetical protein
VSGIDPKGMELAYGRRLFHRYAVISRDALALLDDLVEGMAARKAEFAGRVRVVPISREHPVELLEFDEIGALLRYVGDRNSREAIVDRVAVLTTQGRALGYTVRGYVQEPTKDTVPVRELFPRRICLRVASKSHVAMVLGDHAYDRGAWANRIGESEAGVGYAPSPRRSAAPSHTGPRHDRRPAMTNPIRNFVPTDGDATVWVEQDQLTRAQRALLALSTDVARQLAEDHGVCVRPLAMRRIDRSTGRVDVVPVPCGTTWEDRCRPCAEKARRLRIVQCREGWHLEHEPTGPRTKPTERQKRLLAIRADLHSAFLFAANDGDQAACDYLRETVAELDHELRRHLRGCCRSCASTAHVPSGGAGPGVPELGRQAAAAHPVPHSRGPRSSVPVC